MKKLSFCLYAALAALSVFSGCGQESQVPTGEGQKTTPERGDWIRLAIPNDPDGLHPFGTVHATSTYIKDHLFQFLTDIHPVTLELEPVLVKEMPKISEDGLRYEYHMRPEATWDDGKPITGHDYAFSVKALVNPLSNAPHIRNYYSFIQDVEVDPNDPRHFTVVTGSVFFLSNYALGGFEVIPKHLYDPKGLLDKFSITDLGNDVDGKMSNDPDLIAFSEAFNAEENNREPDHIYGSGPYKLESWVANEKVTLVRKEKWWGDKFADSIYALRAYPDKIIFKTIKDRNTAVRAVAADEIDLIWDVLPEEFERISKDSTDPVARNNNLHLADSYSWTYIGMNMRPPKNRAPLLTEQPVRRALAHLLDVDKIIQNVHRGYGSRIIGPISIHNKNEYHTGLKFIEFNVDKAKALLEGAGWIDTNGDGVRDKVINGRKTELRPELLISTSSTTAPSLAAIFAEDAKKAGVDIKIEKLDFKIISDRLALRDFDMFGLGFNGSPIPADLMQVWHSSSWASGGSNYTGFGDAKTDSIIEQIRVTVDVEARKKLYYQFQEIVYETQPMLFVQSPKERVIINKRFKDQVATVVRPGFKTRSMWVPKAEQKFKAK